MASQSKIVRDFFLANPNRNIHHEESVPAIVSEYEKQPGKKFRDPDRAIRLLHAEGLLQKISKGVYRYDPKLATEKDQKDFTPAQKAVIMKIGKYKCAVCGLSKKDGVELQVDHIRPKSSGGKATISNGQILCGAHNYQKKNYNQTETAKQLFINLHKQAEALDDERLMKFAKDVLATYDKHGVNGHIVWKPDNKSSKH